MQELLVKTLSGASTVLSEKTLARFTSTLRGALLFSGHGEYEHARKIHNGMIDRRPAAIVRCAGAADVLAAVRLARDHDLLFTAKGGGHGVPGFAVEDGAMMIDLSPAKGVRVNPGKRMARAQGGVTWGEFDHETQAFGLATTGGIARPTGIAGLTLAGGHGILMRKYGLACDNLLSADVVTAEGEVVGASLTENPDLFWGLRGGGGNFGIVTSFEYQLHEVGPMLGGLVIYPIDEAKAVLKGYHEFTSNAPDELGSLAILATLPDGTKAVALLLGYNGAIAEGERVLRPLRSLGKVLADQVSPLPYVALQSIVENFNPPGLRNYWKNGYLQDLSDEAIDLIIERFRTFTAPQTHVVLYTIGGAVSRIDPGAAAVARRNARHVFIIVGMWDDPSSDGEMIQSVREFSDGMRQFCSGGFYVNYEAEVDTEKVRSAYTPATYERLVALKRKYDPRNRFRLNQNIRCPT